MEKKSNFLLDVANLLFLMVGGALVIDFVMMAVCRFVDYPRYYREYRELYIIVFEVLVIVRFIAKKLGAPVQILMERIKSSSRKSLQKGKEESHEADVDDEDEQMVELYVKGIDGTRVERVPAKNVNWKWMYPNEKEEEINED